VINQQFDLQQNIPVAFVVRLAILNVQPLNSKNYNDDP